MCLCLFPVLPVGIFASLPLPLSSFRDQSERTAAGNSLFSVTIAELGKWQEEKLLLSTPTLSVPSREIPFWLKFLVLAETYMRYQAQLSKELLMPVRGPG